MDKQLIEHELWAAAQLAPCEGIEDGVNRIAAILARIDAERGKEAVVWAYTINNSHSVFSTEKPPEDAYDEDTLFPLYAAPQPPAPCPAPLDESHYCPDCEALQAKVAEQSATLKEYERDADTVEWWHYRINGAHDGFSKVQPPDDAYDDGTLTPLYKRVRLSRWLETRQQEQIAAQSAEIERLRTNGKRFLLGRASAHATIAQQAALIEKCRDALSLPCDRWNNMQVKIINDALAAIAAQKGGALC